MPFDRTKAVRDFRARLRNESPLVGAWMQVPNADFAEILGDSGYDWVAVDMEHGAFTRAHLHDIFRALELGGTAPMARIAEPLPILCQQVLDAGAAGVIIPRVESSTQLKDLIAGCNWPPTGRRGVGFSRANLYGKHFERYKSEAQASFIVAQVESLNAVQDIDAICSVSGLDAVMIGPYDLSASLGHTGNLEHPELQEAIHRVLTTCRSRGIASGMHVVQPDPHRLREAVTLGHRFLAYGTDVLFMSVSAKNPLSST